MGVAVATVLRGLALLQVQDVLCEPNSRGQLTYPSEFRYLGILTV